MTVCESEIYNRLIALASPEKAKVLASFFKTGKGEYGYNDQFLGITVPQIRSVAKVFYKDCQLQTAENLLANRYHEVRMLALLILRMQFEKEVCNSQREIFESYIKNHTHINNWDLIDLTAPNIVGEHLFGNDCSILYQFANSSDMWCQRIAIVATLNFIRKGEFYHTYNLAKLFLTTKHDLIKKAVGWMLREAGKRDEKSLRDFLEEYKEVMPRTMLRYAIEKFSPQERAYFMGRKNSG